MRRYDLHCHSTRSDGVLTPTEVMRRAAAGGVDVIALTDHDDVAGLDEAGAAKSPRVRQMLHQRVAQLVQHHQANAIPTTLAKITQRAIADVQAQVSEFGGSVVAAPPVVDPNAGQPKRVVPPPPPADAQAQSRHDRDERGRFLSNDPKPRFDHRIPGSIKALNEWKARNPGR
jgi:hypothetical protein